MRVAARVVRVEKATEGANVLRVGLRFEQPLMSLSPASSSGPTSGPTPSNRIANVNAGSSFSESLGFVLEDGLCGGARVVSMNRGGLRLSSDFLPASGTKIKLQLEVDGVPFEVEGKVGGTPSEFNDPSGLDFGVELAVEEGSAKWDLYLALLRRASEVVTAELPAIKVSSEQL
jgi:hypothetical protein